jgi:uncharacterized membrane protein YbaN (DUF454 family)
MGEMQPLDKPLRRIGVVALGWSLAIGGVIGLLLPVIPGWLLIVLGALVLKTEHPWLRRVLQKLSARFPVLKRGLNRVSSWLERWRRPLRMSDSRNSRSQCEL